MTDIVLPTLKMEGYVIVDVHTGLFSSGGTEPKFKKKGKVWSNIGHLKNHLAQFIEPYYTKGARPYRLCKAKVYDIVSGKEVFDVTEYLDKRTEEKKQEQELRHQRYREERKRELERELKKLNQEN
jgi:hypothetical protein